MSVEPVSQSSWGINNSVQSEQIKWVMKKLLGEHPENILGLRQPQCDEQTSRKEENLNSSMQYIFEN